jgi:antitoxin component YwqK of YwqJK toxin-antitoxin module
MAEMTEIKEKIESGGEFKVISTVKILHGEEVIHGKWKVYHIPTGEIEYDVDYVDGKIHGEFQCFLHGKLNWSQSYNNDVAGICKYFDKDGKISMTTNH